MEHNLIKAAENAHELGMTNKDIRKALKMFGGVHGNTRQVRDMFL